MQTHTELWNITTHHRVWVGNADLLIHQDGRVEGTMTFPTDPNGQQNKITGHVSGNHIELVRHLGGTLQGKEQYYHGDYNEHGSAAKGTISGVGGPGDWSAAIVVQ
jgi:hypothetical protein